MTEYCYTCSGKSKKITPVLDMLSQGYGRDAVSKVGGCFCLRKAIFNILPKRCPFVFSEAQQPLGALQQP